ncbi:MAG: ParB N-terminal domain-containing protein, partial [Thermosynechococcaceae cyanobacterium]
MSIKNQIQIEIATFYPKYLPLPHLQEFNSIRLFFYPFSNHSGSSVMEKLEISLIRLDGGTQPRADHSQDLVDEYADAMKAGATFPPITVFSDGADFWLADGFHRIQAASNLGFSVISVEIIHGSLRDAVLYSTGVNATHGLRRSNDDKRKAVLTLLLDPEWSQWSDREISRKCGVSNRFVSNLRKEVTVNGSQSLLRKGGDGRTINTSNIGKGLKSNENTSKDEEASDDFDAPSGQSLNMLYGGEDNLFPIIDITAETIADESKSPNYPNTETAQPKQHQISHTFEIGDRVRIIRRQNGQEKWSGYIGNVWEITVDGWLRV